MDKTLVNLLVIKLVKFRQNFIVSQQQLSMTDMHCTGKASGKLSNSSEMISCLQIRLNHGLSCLGRDVGGLLQAPAETQVNRHQSPYSKSIAGELGQPATGTNQQDC